MIVVDTNVIAYLYLSSVRSEQAENLLLEDPAWAVPLLWRSELRNVLAMTIQKDLLSLADAVQIMEEALKLVRGREFEVTSLDVLSLVATSTCSAYDCEFVALAQSLGVPMVTADKRILAQFPEVARPLDRFGLD